jgi:hypothetical protein
MPSYPSSTVPVSTLWQRAWIFSLVVHLLTSAILALTVQKFRGAALQQGYTSGIVLQLSMGESKPEPAHESIVASITAIPSAEAQPTRPPLPQPDPEPVEKQLETPRTPTALTGDIAAAQQRSHANQDAQNSISRRRGSRGFRAGAIGAGSEATVSVFGVAGTGTKFVYLFDRSASMEGVRLAAAKRQLFESLESLDTIHQFQIIFFNSLPYPIDITGSGRMAYATEQNKQLAKNVVGGVTADLGTDRYMALKKAISFSPDVIFFLTDADDEMLASELAEIERANNRIGAAICVIEFGQMSTPARENFLMRLARQTGGQYGYVNTVELAQ